MTSSPARDHADDAAARAVAHGDADDERDGGRDARSATMSASSAPASGAIRAIGSDLNRSNTPLSMSSRSWTPVTMRCRDHRLHEDAGEEIRQVRLTSPAIAPPKMYVNMTVKMIGCIMTSKSCSGLRLILRRPRYAIVKRVGDRVAGGDAVGALERRRVRRCRSGEVTCGSVVRRLFGLGGVVAGDGEEDLVEARLLHADLVDRDAALAQRTSSRRRDRRIASAAR